MALLKYVKPLNQKSLGGESLSSLLLHGPQFILEPNSAIFDNSQSEQDPVLSSTANYGHSVERGPYTSSHLLSGMKGS